MDFGLLSNRTKHHYPDNLLSLLWNQQEFRLFPKQMADGQYISVRKHWFFLFVIIIVISIFRLVFLVDFPQLRIYGFHPHTPTETAPLDWVPKPHWLTSTVYFTKISSRFFLTKKKISFKSGQIFRKDTHCSKNYFLVHKFFFVQLLFLRYSRFNRWLSSQFSSVLPTEKIKDDVYLRRCAMFWSEFLYCWVFFGNSLFLRYDRFCISPFVNCNTFRT